MLTDSWDSLGAMGGTQESLRLGKLFTVHRVQGLADSSVFPGC